MSISSKEVEQRETIIVSVEALDLMRNEIATLKAQRDEARKVCIDAYNALLKPPMKRDEDWWVALRAIARPAVEKEGK